MIVLTVKHGNDRLRKGNTSHGIKSSFLPYIYYQNPQNAPQKITENYQESQSYES